MLSDVGRRAAYDFALHRAAEQREGYDVTYDVVVTPDEAHAGITKVLTFHRADGQPYDLAVSIPAGSRSGDHIRVAGAGGPSVDGMSRGCLYAVITIINTLPTVVLNDLFNVGL
jgi:DnaJ-class molecular chaperone